MEITEVRIRLVDKGKLKAFATITLDDCFVIRGLKIIGGRKGLFVAMPSKKRECGRFQDITHPINSSMRNWMELVVLAKFLTKYEEALARPEGDDMEGSGVRSPLYPPFRPLFGWQARELFEDDRDRPRTVGS